MLKSELRKSFLEKRNQLTDDTFTKRNEQLGIQVVQYFKNLPSNQTIGSFLPIIDKKEIDTRSLNQQLTSFPFLHRLCFPRVITDKKMDFFTIDSVDELEISNWGIPEPKEDPTKLIQPKDIQILFIPLIAFDENGHRVGYGKGFYDQYLVRCSSNIIKIGLSLFDEISIIDDIEATDIALDIILTPNLL